ncbi:PIG-L deacetylase family protein [Nocardioides terrisoli]|uniref:PIG-L deacetylase family protein n=1 Tax=Nocardioides terrisoli TaxID=3388267 RepID=UPI00287BB7A2|nr:PIG-L deacetylase family protein [Nocardioides marmorisolisilvae]
MTEQPARPEPLEPLPEDWSSALCIVAHPDDMEFGTAAAVARWTGQGKRIVYCMVTSGEAGIDGIAPDECREVREAEQVASARVVGVDEVDFLRRPDGIVEYGVDLRRILAEEVRRHRPEIVITGNFRDTFGGTNLNQADHIAVGRAVLDAVRDAANRWIFHEQLEPVGSTPGALGLEPWSGVRAVWAASSPLSTHGVDTTETFDAGVASLEAHRAYIEGLGWEQFDPREFLEGISRANGQRMGVAFAAPFEVFPMGWGG